MHLLKTLCLYNILNIVSGDNTGILKVGANSEFRLDIASKTIVEDGGDNEGQSTTISYKKPDDSTGTLVFKKGILTSYT